MNSHPTKTYIFRYNSMHGKILNFFLFTGLDWGFSSLYL